MENYQVSFTTQLDKEQEEAILWFAEQIGLSVPGVTQGHRRRALIKKYLKQKGIDGITYAVGKYREYVD